MLLLLADKLPKYVNESVECKHQRIRSCTLLVTQSRNPNRFPSMWITYCYPGLAGVFFLPFAFTVKSSSLLSNQCSVVTYTLTICKHRQTYRSTNPCGLPAFSPSLPLHPFTELDQVSLLHVNDTERNSRRHMCPLFISSLLFFPHFKRHIAAEKAASVRQTLLGVRQLTC